MNGTGLNGDDAVVVTSAAVLNSLAEDLDGYAKALEAGRSALALTGNRLPVEARANTGAWLDGFTLRGWADRHLAGDLGARSTLLRAAGRSAMPAQTAACVAVQAVREGQLSPQAVARAAAIVAGSNLAMDYQGRMAIAFHEGRAPLPSHALAHMDIDTVGAVSEAIGCRGEGWCLGASAASGTLALVQGIRLVRTGEVDHCLVVGACSEMSAAELRALADVGALANTPEGADPVRTCRPFDEARHGFVPGQGSAAVLLERAGTARARGRAPLAVLSGYGLGLEGRRGMEPSLQGQVASLSAALERARLTPQDIGYVNAHATGTRAGDLCEAEAIHQVFGAGPYVNSTKALIGHCMASAGIQEVIATLLQLRGGFCHPNPNLTEPCHPGLSFVTDTAARLDARAAVKSTVGVSGISAALVITSAAEESSCNP